MRWTSMDHRCLSINKHWILTVGIEILRTRGSVKQPRWSDDSSGNVPTCVQMSQSKSGGCGEMPHEDCSPEIDLGENCSCGSCSEGEMFQLRSHSGRELSFSHWRQVARLESSVKDPQVKSTAASVLEFRANMIKGFSVGEMASWFEETVG